MATYFSLSSSTFLYPSKPLKHYSSIARNPPPHCRRPFSVTALHSQPPLPPAVESFWQWLRQQGVVSAKCSVRPGVVPEGLGLIAQRDIAKQEAVLKIPKRLWINPDMVSASEIGSVCDGLKPWVSVALFLMTEKLKEDSSWKPYFDVLPNSTNSTIYWSEKELAELQGSQLLSRTLDVKEFLQREFLNIQEELLVPRKDLFPLSLTFDDFLWAFGMIRSRAFSIGGQNLVMIPLVDLINHSSDITTEDHVHEEIGPAGLFSWDLLFCLRSPIPVKAGEQVFIQYSLQKTNADMAVDYGFIETNPDRTAYTLTFQISDSDPFSQDKLDIAVTNDFGETADFDIVLGKPLPPSLLPYLRLVELGGPDAFLLESTNFRNIAWRHLEFPISRANEELVCRVVRDACKSALAGYHTTIEEDNKVKQGGDLDPRLEIAVEIRLGEKKVLHQIDGIFQNKESELDELVYYQERTAKELSLVGEKGESIFMESK